MKASTLKIVGIGMVASALATGCAYVQAPADKVEQETSISEQQVAQQEALTAQTPTLKRKIAIGRISNESSYGKSLLRDQFNDPLGKQLTDMLSKDLVQSGNFIVLERPDLGRLIAENNFAGTTMDKVGADVLLMGSLTEFGRKTDGKSGFLTSTKRQLATATVDVRLVDVQTGRVIFATTGKGEAVTESGSVLGWGDNRAEYDATLSDKAIATAISEVVSGIVTELQDDPWQTYFLSIEPGQLIFSGGKNQGIKVGDEFVVKTVGKKVKSAQTGFTVTLPGTEIARVRVISQFGNDAVDEGSVCELISGSLGKYGVSDLVIEEIK